MTRLLLLTSDGTVPDEIVEAVAERAAAGDVEARVLVPLQPLPDAWEWDEAATQAAMLERIDAAIASLASTGARVEGTVGHDRDPMVCVNWLMAREPFDEVLVARRPSGGGRLLRMDLATRIRRAFHVPVTSVSASRHAGAAA